MRGPRLAPRDAAEAALGAWAAVQVFFLLAERDRFEVLFSLDPASLPFVAVLWVRNLAVAAAASAAFVALLRLTGRWASREPEEGPPRPGPRGLAVSALALVALLGVAARWALPEELPPGLWCDVAYEAEAALDAPESEPLWGAIPLALDGRPSSTMVSNAYLAFCRGVFALFGGGEAGLRAVSAVPATFVPLAGALLAGVAWGRRRALVAFALLSLCRWPLVFAYWTWTGTAVTLLAAAAALGAAFSLRSRGPLGPAAAGLFTGLSFHAHPASAGAALGLGAFALPALRDPAGRRRVALAAVAAVAAAAPFFAGFAEHPSRLGGRPRDVSVLSPSRRPGVPESVPGRLAQNVVRYTGSFLFAVDPNPRHGIPGEPSATPLVGIAIAIGAATALRAALAGSGPDLLLVAAAAGGLLPGILSNPAGSPNTTRTAAAMVPLLLLAAGPLATWGAALARLLGARIALVAGLGLAALVAFEASTVPARWAADPLVVSWFGPEETTLGRALRPLAAAETYLAPGAVRDPIVLEACAADPRPLAPLRRFPKRTPAELGAAPPAGPFWYVAREPELRALAEAGFAVAPGTRAGAGASAPRLARVRPPWAAPTASSPR